jgi:hypothetical protein
MPVFPGEKCPYGSPGRRFTGGARIAWEISSLAEPTAKSPPPRVPTVEAWRRTLSQIPTLFGRLVYLASLRDPASGRYRHEVLNTLMDAEDSDRALSRGHHRLFSEWLAHGMEEQRRDLDEYLRTAGAPGDVRQYHNLVPPRARDVERQLFLSDLETLLELRGCARHGAA